MPVSLGCPFPHGIKQAINIASWFSGFKKHLISTPIKVEIIEACSLFCLSKMNYTFFHFACKFYVRKKRVLFFIFSWVFWGKQKQENLEVCMTYAPTKLSNTKVIPCCILQGMNMECTSGSSILILFFISDLLSIVVFCRISFS